MRRLTILTTLTGLAIGAAAITTDDAQAHFRLEAPAVMTEMNDLGDPQKTYACGGGADAALTGDVTAYTAGETITITVDETIYHPGHYRVALAMEDVSELPPDAVVTPVGNDDCATAAIMDPPVFPILADGMLLHNSPFGGSQSFEVTLPDDVSCENCTLQVVEFMSQHVPSCFYYHCANISIAPAEGGETTGGDGTTGESTTGDPTDPSGPDTTGQGTTADPSTAGDSDSDSGSDSNADTTNASGSGSTGALTGTGTDGMGEADGDDGGCSVGEPNTAGLLGLLPLLAFRRRRRS